MKNLFLTAVFLLSAVCVNAQKELAVENQYPGDEKAREVYLTAVDKQANSTAVRTTWVANKPNSNWFFSLEGGVARLLSENSRDLDAFDDLVPTGGLSVGKWFSPVWGLRINATGAQLKGYSTSTTGLWYTGKHYPTAGSIGYYSGDGSRFLEARDGGGYTNEVTYAAGTLDFLVNLKNLFTHYNPKAFFNPVIYAGLGYAHTFGSNDFDNLLDLNDNVTAVNSIVEKFGLQLNFRLGDRWDLYLDAQAITAPDNFDRLAGGSHNMDIVANARLGLTYRFNFRHFIKAPLYDQAEVDALNREINELRNRPGTVCPPAPACPPVPVCPEVKQPEPAKTEELTPVFFTIGSYVVRDNQLVNVAKAAEYLIGHPGSKLELASYADKNTGTPSLNLQLSKNRSNAVANLLTGKFGIDKSRLVLKHYGDKVQPFAENDWNRVTIFIIP
ncbi:MAG: OmpA family protein [Candidatus Symbiothrix sp.]|jgi:outer membrane protein OmpA-like peptidoglycan-associated protein|nr:OmpA family protein [Candidatus Symbiothrix sp.]